MILPMRSFLCLATAIVALGLPAIASASSTLRHPCSFRYGVGAYQDVSYEDQTNCAEAKIVIAVSTHEGRRRPVLGARTVRLPHSTWRCATVRRREVHGEIVSSHQVTCTLRAPHGYTARVRFFYES
jgi:hypothetical protein